MAGYHRARVERSQTIVRFVGRARELARLEDAAADASSGRPRVVLVAGEAGAGKSRLVDEFAARRRAIGELVLDGACLPLGSAGPPYAPIVGVLRSLRRSVAPAALPAILALGGAISVGWCPSSSTGLPTSVRRPRGLDPTSQTRLFELFAGAIERLARDTPVVLAIEDVHWADRSSRDLIDFVVRGLPATERLLIVMTCRTDDAIAAEVVRWLAELERLREVERLDVPPLGREDVAELVSEVLGRPDDELAGRIAARAGGNPFLVEELAMTGGDGGALSDQLRAVLIGRLAGLSVGSRDLLRAASASARPLDDHVLGRSSMWTREQLGTSIREVTAQGHLIRMPGAGEDGRSAGYAFRHALLREVIYDELLPSEQAALHAAYAEQLDADAAAGRAIVSQADIAYHWDAAGVAERALPAHVRAGREAALVFAHAEARRHLDRALELWPLVPDPETVTGIDLPEVLDEAATASALDGDHTTAVQRIRQALDVVDPADDPVRAGALNERLRFLLWEAGDPVAAQAAVHEALAVIPESPPSAARARAVAHDAGLDMMAGRPRPALAKARQAAEMARLVSGLPEEALALGIEGWAMAALGRVDDGVAAFRQGLAIAELLGSIEGQAIGYANLVAMLDRAGRVDDALEAAREAFATAERHGLVRTFGGLARGHEARLLFHLGRWSEAGEVIAASLADRPIPSARLFLLIQRCRLDAAQGRASEARTSLDEAHQIARSLPGTDHRADLLEAMVEAAAWAGDEGEGRAAVDEALRIPTAGQLPDPALAWVVATGVRIEADVAERARATRDGASVEIAGGRAMRLVEWARGWLPAGDLEVQADAARQMDPRAAAIVALLRAEETRLQGRPDPAALARGGRCLGRRRSTAAGGIRSLPPGGGRGRDRRSSRRGVETRQGRLRRRGPSRRRATSRRCERLAHLLRIDPVPACRRSDLHGGTPVTARQTHPSVGDAGRCPRSHRRARSRSSAWSLPAGRTPRSARRSASAARPRASTCPTCWASWVSRIGSRRRWSPLDSDSPTRSRAGPTAMARPPGPRAAAPPAASIEPSCSPTSWARRPSSR